MKRVMGMITAVLGAILIIAAVLWSFVFLGMILKVPGDIDASPEYEGEMTWYVDPVTGQSLPAGSELVTPFGVVRNVKSLDSEYTSSTAVIQEEIFFSVAGMDLAPLSFVYVVDRKNMKNIDDARAYAFAEEFKVDRAGFYFPCFPFDLNEDQTYQVWKNEINAPTTVSFIGEDERDGLTVYKYEMIVDEEPAWEGYVKAFGLPTELTLDEFKTQLSAMGVDIDALFALAGQVMSAEDMQTMMEYAQQPIPIIYTYSTASEICMEPKTAAIVDVYKDDETLSMELDSSGLQDLFSMLMKYRQDPVLGPEIDKLVTLAAQMGQAGAQKVITYQYAQTDQSVAETVQDVRDGKNLLKLVTLWVPMIVAVVGALLLTLGLVILSSARKERSAQV